MDENLIQTLIEELQESKQRDRDVINAMQENIKSLNKTLLGNGAIGLCEVVRNMEISIKNVKASIKPVWGLMISLIIVIIGTAFMVLWK